jgi:hypothetical protein
VVGPSACGADSTRTPSTPFEPGAQEPSGDLLFLSRFRFDPVAGEPDLPAEQTTQYAPGETGFHLVQLVGPTERGQLDALADAGADVVQFQPTHAYIVRMTPEQASVVRTLPFVRAVVVYHAAYRIAPSVLPADGPDGPKVRAAQVTGVIENVDVTIFDDGTVAETIAAIEALGGKQVEHFTPVPVGRLVTAIFTIPADAIAARSSIACCGSTSARLCPASTTSCLIRSSPGISPGAPFTGYNTWLGGVGLSGNGCALRRRQRARLRHPTPTVAGVSHDGAVPVGDACNNRGTHVAGSRRQRLDGDRRRGRLPVGPRRRAADEPGRTECALRPLAADGWVADAQPRLGTERRDRVEQQLVHGRERRAGIFRRRADP